MFSARWNRIPSALGIFTTFSVSREVGHKQKYSISLYNTTNGSDFDGEYVLLYLRYKLVNVKVSGTYRTPVLLT